MKNTYSTPFVPMPVVRLSSIGVFVLFSNEIQRSINYKAMA